MEPKCDKTVLAAIGEAGRRLGYQEVREKQREVVFNFIKGKDVFVSLPTGSGKSLCYSILPWTFDVLKKQQQSIIVVVSPLVALMKDQVASFTSRGLSSIYIGEVNSEEKVARVHEGKYQVIFFSPELLLNDEVWRDMLQSSMYRENLVGLIIDEAHCVKKWGEKFRRAFANLGEVRSLIAENVHLMALTATATRASRTAICRILGMTKPHIIAMSPNKNNINYSVATKSSSIEETFAPLAEEIRRLRVNVDKTIIFSCTYESVTSIYRYFKSRLGKGKTEPPGYPDVACFRILDMFTSCTHPEVKDSILESFRDPSSTLRLVIATIAFGMGLDCPNVRRIIHWGPPDSIESYLQETGRAGRDGRAASALLYFVPADISKIHVAQEMRDYCKLKEGCRRSFMLKYFDTCTNSDVNVSGCKCCDLCKLTCKCSVCT